MKTLRLLMPMTSIAVLTFTAILPWGLAFENRFVLPLLPVAAIYYWTVERNAWLPEWFLFLAGLLLDALTQGPLGYWALIYLMTYVVGVYASQLRLIGWPAKLGLFAGAIVAVSAFAWLLASIYSLELVDMGPYARGAVFEFMAALVLIGIWRTVGPPVRPVRLERGR